MEELRDRPFHKHVELEPRFGKRRTVRTVLDAGRVLVREWPGEGGPKKMKAMATVLAALKGRCKPSKARTALIEAAKADRILAADREDFPEAAE